VQKYKKTVTIMQVHSDHQKKIKNEI